MTTSIELEDPEPRWVAGMTTPPICRSCREPAVVRLYGHFRNGRPEAIDLRCAEHAPQDDYGELLVGPQPRRPLSFYGSTARLFRIEDIERVTRR